METLELEILEQKELAGKLFGYMQDSGINEIAQKFIGFKRHLEREQPHRSRKTKDRVPTPGPYQRKGVSRSKRGKRISDGKISKINDFRKEGSSIASRVKSLSFRD